MRLHIPVEWPFVIGSHLFALYAHKHKQHVCFQRSNVILFSTYRRFFMLYAHVSAHQETMLECELRVWDSWWKSAHIHTNRGKKHPPNITKQLLMGLLRGGSRCIVGLSLLGLFNHCCCVNSGQQDRPLSDRSQRKEWLWQFISTVTATIESGESDE